LHIYQAFVIVVVVSMSCCWISYEYTYCCYVIRFDGGLYSIYKKINHNKFSYGITNNNKKNIKLLTNLLLDL